MAMRKTTVEMKVAPRTRRKKVRQPKGTPMGRPPHKVTKKNRELVALLAAVGTPHRNIASVLDMALLTLRQYYKDELNEGKIKTHSMLVNNLARMSRGKDSVALKATIFLLQTKFGVSKLNALPGGDDDKPNNASPPVGDDGKPLGKKEAMEVESHVAHKNTSWGELIDPAKSPAN